MPLPSSLTLLFVLSAEMLPPLLEFRSGFHCR